VQLCGAVHGEFERESGEALDFFGGVAGPLGDELDHRWREVGVGVNGHSLEGKRARDHQQGYQDQDQEPLTEGELDYLIDHEFA
jgi:hypothetical protein